LFGVEQATPAEVVLDPAARLPGRLRHAYHQVLQGAQVTAGGGRDVVGGALEVGHGRLGQPEPGVRVGEAPVRRGEHPDRGAAHLAGGDRVHRYAHAVDRVDDGEDRVQVTVGGGQVQVHRFGLAGRPARKRWGEPGGAAGVQYVQAEQAGRRGVRGARGDAAGEE